MIPFQGVMTKPTKKKKLWNKWKLKSSQVKYFQSVMVKASKHSLLVRDRTVVVSSIKVKYFVPPFILCDMHTVWASSPRDDSLKMNSFELCLLQLENVTHKLKRVEYKKPLTQTSPSNLSKRYTTNQLSQHTKHAAVSTKKLNTYE